MNRTFRRYHRIIAIAACAPLLLTVLLLTVVSGVGITIAHEWLHRENLTYFLMRVHTLEIFKLQAFYPLLNGLGLIGLLVTGITMTGLFRKGRDPKNAGEL